MTDAGQGMPELVLLVEDNIIILMDTEDVLRDLGVLEVVTATTAAEALAHIQSRAPSFALLDVALGDTTSFEVAERLDALGIPFAFVTGYGDRRGLPPQFAHRPCLVKPHSTEALKAVLLARRD